MRTTNPNTMKSEDQLRDILEKKAQLTRKVEEHEAELEHIHRNIAELDSIIKKSSFTRASELEPSTAPPPITELDDAPSTDSRPIRVDSKTVAQAIVTPDELKIIINDDVTITSDTPPLKIFFVDRIIGGMRSKDEASAQNGQIESDSVIECAINEDDKCIRDITIRNYRDKERADEIISSVSWSLARMMENSAKR